MEELQLTLTPSRVDQRNQGIMLANWRVGQTINALVTDRMPSGGVLLSVGSQTFITPSDIPVQPGSRIQLEVQQTEPKLLLRLIDSSSAVSAHRTPDIFVNGRPLGAGQSELNALSNLFKGLGGNFLGSSLNVREMKALLASNFLAPSDINAKSVQAALVLSGIFTEALWLSSRPSLAARSTKTILMILRHRIASGSESSALSSKEKAALTRLLISVESSIASITHKQISSLPQDSERPKWLATLPLQLGEEICEVDVEIERRARQHCDDDIDWKFSFSLTLEKLGPVKVLIKMDDGRLQIDIAVDAITAGLLTESLPILRDRLLASDLALKQLTSSALKPNTDEMSGLNRVNLDVSA